MTNKETQNNTSIAELALKRWADGKKDRESMQQDYLANFTHLYIEQWLTKDIPAGNRPKISLFLSADTIRQYRAKLFPGRAEVGVKFYNQNNKKETDTQLSEYENQVLETYAENNMPNILHEQSEYFFVGGNACIFHPHNPITDAGKGAETMIFSIDPTHTTITYAGNKMIAGMHEQTISAQDAKKIEWCNLSNDIADDAILSDIYYFDKYNYCRIINQDPATSKTLENPYIEKYAIPYTWIPNNAQPGTINGKSELRHLKVLDRELNLRISDYSERLRNGVLGPLFVTGAGKKPNISLDADFINYLEMGGKAERLGLAGDSQDYLDYFNFILDIYQKKTTITDDIIGTKNSNVAASGIAMQYKFLSLQELIDEKRLTWDYAITRINKAICYYKFGDVDKYRNKPIYQNSLPTDETITARNNALLVEAGLKDRETAIDELNPNDAANDIIKKIDKDKQDNPEFYKNSKQVYNEKDTKLKT